MNRVFVVFLVFLVLVGAGLLSLACGTATPTASKAIGASSSAAAGTSLPTATLVPAKVPTETRALTDTPTPATSLPLTAPSFQEILATRENEALTSVQKQDFIDKLVGQRVVDWQGVVSDARPFLDVGMVDVDLPGGGSHDILFNVSREELANFNKQQAIKLSGRIELVNTVPGSFSLTLHDVTYELGEVPPTNTPPPTNTRTPTSTLKPTNTLTPTATIAPTNTVPAPAATRIPTAKFKANLRAGPGITYAVVGVIPAGTALEIVARTSARDWYLLSSRAWIAAQLVDGAPDVPVAEAIPTPTTSPPSTLVPTRPS